MKRAMHWAILNGALLGLIIDAIVYHETWALNVVRFAIWAMTVLATVAILSKDVRMKARAKGRSVPKWLSVTYDLAIIALLASAGHFWCAGAWLWQMMCEAGIYDMKEEAAL